MPGKYDNAFPNAQKVQIFEQVDTYIETQHNHATDPKLIATITDLQTFLTQLHTRHPNVTSETEALAIIDAEFTEIRQSPTHPLARLRQQLLNPERHLQAAKATVVEVTKAAWEKSLIVKAFITYLDKLSEDPNQGD
ncbi:hypothetical protein BST81_06515 [Leptolyngbya sp. 'hensonii']|uniref:hypothetical protein n=1 Tax=Leptolyngbya sp. 'hensonii' TaxID=1922337 RepID=UPI00094F566F|nr:hypothetical protein [Leptolyngbya sp. 'hensonii']OLP19393.1 hypothetical protein BST81_06515 [Leptolyngbya sp. 'hensonii']